MQGNSVFRHPESAMAHKYLDGLRGIEIGGSWANQFGLNTLNVDYTDEENIFHVLDKKLSRHDSLKVDIVANGDDLPFRDNVWDFVINSHVIEHFFDPIRAIEEWLRVIKPGGYLYMIVPHKARTFDKDRNITTLDEIIGRHNGEINVRDYAASAAGMVADNEVRDVLIYDGAVPPGYSRMIADDHHHWNVWDTGAFLELLKHMNLDVVEYQDVDDKVGNGFAVVLMKQRNGYE
jgi:SAM-dependent methyltransferase